MRIDLFTYRFNLRVENNLYHFKSKQKEVQKRQIKLHASQNKTKTHLTKPKDLS